MIYTTVQNRNLPRFSIAD